MVDPGHPEVVDSPEVSVEKGKPVLFVFTAAWCGPCQQMKASVYHSPEVEEVGKQFHWVFVDIDLPENKALSAQYGVRSIPSYFIEDSSGNVLASRKGGTSPAEFRKFLQAAL